MILHFFVTKTKQRTTYGKGKESNQSAGEEKSGEEEIVRTAAERRNWPGA
jgi:hypothetical protein